MSEASDIQRRFFLFEQGLLDEDATNELRQDIYDIASARDLDLFEGERTASGQAYETGKAAARGFLSSFATIGEGLGEQADALTNLIGAEDFIDSGEENELVRISREAQESIQERLGADVAYRDQWLTKFGEGAGSFGSFLVPGGALKALGLGKTALGVTTTQAAGVGAGEQAQRIERAREQGIEVSPEQEDAAILWGSGVGLTELAPVQRILSKISKSADADFKKGIAARLKSALVSGGVEGLQEVTASILQDAVERGVYNENLPFNDSLLDDFTVGGAVGAFADLAVSAAAGRGRDRRNIVAERELREAEQQDIETVAERVSEGQEQERARMLAAEDTSPEFLRGEVEELTATPEFIVEDDATPDDLLDFQETLDKEMAGVGLSDVKANIFHSLRNVLRNREGNLVYGIRTRRRDDQDVRLFGGQSGIVIEESPETADGQVAEGLYSNAAGEIFLAADALPKEGTLDQQRDAAVGVLRHEQLHAMRALDLFTDSEWNILTNAVNQKNKKGTSGSYADWARGEYSNLSPIEQTEEAVAEMTRDLRADNTIVTGKPRTLVQRIIDFFPKLNSFLRGRGYTSFDSLIRDIDSGKIGGRKRGEIRTLRALEEAGQAPRVPDFDPSATINQEREEDFPDPERADKLSVRKTDDDDPDRIFPDLPLSARRRGLSQAFLKENGYEEYDPDLMLDGRPDYDHYISNADGSVVAYNYQGKDVNGKAKFSRKTFRNPTLNSLINWMEGGGQRTAAPKVDEKLSFENLYERYASGLLTEEEFNSELVNIKPSDLDKKPEDSDELRKAKSDAVRRIGNIDRHGKAVEDENFKFLKTIPTDKFGNELPQFLYHNVYQRGFNQSGGISKYTFQPTDAYRGEKNLENMVMLSRAPISDGAARIDVSKLPDYKKKLVDLVVSEGHFSYKGDIPSNAIIEKDVSKKEADASYRMDHQTRRGPDDEAVRLDDLTRTISGLQSGYPEDFYSLEGRRIYAPGPRFAGDEFGKANEESMSVIYSSRGEPDNTVTMYRAVPEGVDQINVGDFVTLSPTYAEVHASSGYGNDGQQAGKVISQEVKVRDLIWQTDDVNEFGYFPQDITSEQEESPTLERTRADGTTVGGDPVLQKITRDKGAVRKVVEENEKAATTPSVSVPPFSQLADPEAQYVAKKPEEGIKPTPELKDKFSRRSEPEMSPEISKLVDGIAAEPSLPVTPGETYLDVTESSKLDFYLDKAKQAAINKYARLERYSRDPVFKDNLADTSAIAAAYFADRSMGVTASALKYGVPVYENGVTRVKAFYHNGKQYRGLIDVMAPLYQNDYNVSLERLAQAYAIAKRAEDQRARGLKTPVPEGSLKELEAEIAKYKNKDGVPIIEEWYGVWQAYNNKTIEFMKATGIVDDALAQKWIEMSDYVPFYRQGEVEDGEIANIATNAPVMFKRNMTTAIKLKRLAGSESAVNVPMLDAITRNLSMAIDAGMKNVAQQRIVRDMLKIGLATEATRAQRKNASQNFVVNFKVNGVDQYYKIHDPLIYESLQSVEETTGLVTTAFGFPSKVLRELVTRDPGFMLANMMRDTLSAYVTSGADFTPVVDTVANYGKDIEALESFGVVGGYDFMNDPDDMVKAFSKESKKRGINIDGKNAIFNPFKAVWDWAGQGTTLSDAATRKAVYEDVLARTGNEAEAAFQALEVINFSRRGRNPAVRFLTTAIPFLNARFQGLDVLYRGFMGYNPAQRNLTRGQATLTALSRASLITASTLAYWLMFSDSEEYKESTDEQKDLNWIFPNPFGERPIRIPVPFEVGLLFKTIPERILDTYDVAEVFGKPGATTDRELFESIVVRGVGSTLEINPLGVQAVGPLFEAAINHNSFTGAPIVPVYVDKNGIEGFLGLESSTEFSKAVGLAMDINPRKIDHVLYGYGGTIGAYIIDAIDRGVFKNPDIFDKDSAPPTMTVDQYPVVKRFLINKFSSGDRQDFYRLRREVDKVTGTMQDLEDAGRYDELEAVLRSKGHLLAIEKDINYISRQLTKLRNERQEIERAPLSLISAEEKTEEIERILEEMEYYVRDVPKLKKYANLPATAGIPLSDVVDILIK